MMLFFFTTTSDAFYIVLGAAVMFIITLATLITALGVIWTKMLKPIRDKFDERILKPIQEVSEKIINFSNKLEELSNRLASLEETIKTTDLTTFNGKISVVLYDIAYLKFKMRRHSKRSANPEFILDEKGECIFINTALCDLMDCDSQDLEGKNWAARIVPSERKHVAREWQMVYESGAIFEMEQTVIIRNRHEKVCVKAEPFIYEGIVRNYFGTISLVTA